MSTDARAGRWVVLIFTLLVAGSAILKTGAAWLSDPSQRDWPSTIGLVLTLALCFMLWKGDTAIKWLFIVMCLVRGTAAVLALILLPFTSGSWLLLLPIAVNLSVAAALMFSDQVEAFFEYQRESLKF